MTRFLTSALLAATATGAHAAAGNAGAAPDMSAWPGRCHYLYRTIEDPKAANVNEEKLREDINYKIIYSNEWHKIQGGDENLRERLVRDFQACRNQGNQGLKNRAEYVIMMLKQIGLEHCLALAPSDAEWNAQLRYWMPDNASAADKKKAVAKMRQCINADSWTYAGQPAWQVKRTKEFARAVIAKASAGGKPAPRPAVRPEDRRKERPEDRRRREDEEARRREDEEARRREDEEARRRSGESTEDAKPTEEKPTEEKPTEQKPPTAGAATENKADEDAKLGGKGAGEPPAAGTEDATAVCAELKARKTAEELKALVPKDATEEQRKAIAATYEPCLKVDDAEISKNAQTVIDAATKGGKGEDKGSNCGLIVGLVLAALAVVTAVVVVILCCCTGAQEADEAVDSP